MKWNKHLDILVRLAPLCRTPGTGLSHLETENLLQILECRDKSRKRHLHCPPFIRWFYLATSTDMYSFSFVIIKESFSVFIESICVCFNGLGAAALLPCVVVIVSVKQPLRIWVCKSIPVACNAKS